MYILLQREWSFWDIILNFNGFLIPHVILGILTILSCIVLKRSKAERYSSVTTQGLVVFQILIGASLSILSAYQIRMDLNTGHVLLDGLYYGWQVMWLPALVSIFTILILIMIEVFYLSFNMKAAKRTGDTK
ncbi:MAG: hypothetical protein ABJ387_14695 [Balneola sp.]